MAGFASLYPLYGSLSIKFKWMPYATAISVGISLLGEGYLLRTRRENAVMNAA